MNGFAGRLNVMCLACTVRSKLGMNKGKHDNDNCQQKKIHSSVSTWTIDSG